MKREGKRGVGEGKEERERERERGERRRDEWEGREQSFPAVLSLHSNLHLSTNNNVQRVQRWLLYCTWFEKATGASHL